jgi:SPP1 family predicted phage head-tail adaptor
MPAKRLGAGALTELIVIQQKTTTPDTQGGRAVAPATLATVWASVVAAGANERLQIPSVDSLGQYVVTIRYRADVSPQMKVSWTPYGGAEKVLQILGVQPLDGQRVFLVLTCGEVA